MLRSPGRAVPDVAERDHSRALHRIPGDHRAEGHEAAAVRDACETSPLPDAEPPRIRDRVAPGQDAAAVHALGEPGHTQQILVESPVPPRQIRHRRVQPAVSDLVEVDQVVGAPGTLRGGAPVAVRGGAPVSVRGRVVAEDAAGHDVGALVVEMRARHAEWAEDLLIRVLAERPPGGALHDLGHEHVTGIAVQVLGARRKVELSLTGDQPQHVLVAQDVLVRCAREAHQGEIVPHAAGMMDEVADRDRALCVVGELGNVSAHRVVQRQMTLVLRDQDPRPRRTASTPTPGRTPSAR